MDLLARFSASREKIRWLPRDMMLSSRALLRMLTAPIPLTRTALARCRPASPQFSGFSPRRFRVFHDTTRLKVPYCAR